MGDEEVLDLFAEPPSTDTLLALQQLDPNSPTCRQALRLLADGTRIEGRREAYGQLGFLDFVLGLQYKCQHGRDDALRAVANLCADNGKADDVLLESGSLFAIC